MKDDLTVLYNGTCPVCSREIGVYERYCSARALPVDFEPLQTADLSSWGVGTDAAARRLHVRKDGKILSGVPAFVALWASMPSYRWLAPLVSLPIVRPIAEVVYDRVLAPALFRMHKRRERRTTVLAADKRLQ